MYKVIKIHLEKDIYPVKKLNHQSKGFHILVEAFDSIINIVIVVYNKHSRELHRLRILIGLVNELYEYVSTASLWNAIIIKRLSHQSS